LGFLFCESLDLGWGGGFCDGAGGEEKGEN